jgi:hypothetical protein
VNRYRPYVLVLPEDDANRQIANGFLLDPGLRLRQIQVLKSAGGWTSVVQACSDLASEVHRNPNCHVVLLIDFDGQVSRGAEVRGRIPDSARDRIYVLGARSQPEELRQAIGGTYETIGLSLAKDCLEGTGTIWGHDLLSHNTDELSRLRQHVRPFLFQA